MGPPNLYLLMAIPFPALTPTRFRWTGGDYPIRLAPWRGIAEFPRLLGSIATRAQFQLSWSNITDADAAAFAQVWRETLNGGIPVTLPSELIGGVKDTNLQTRVLAPTGLITVMTALSVDAVKAGRSSVTATLTAELRGVP